VGRNVTNQSDIQTKNKKGNSDGGIVKTCFGQKTKTGKSTKTRNLIYWLQAEEGLGEMKRQWEKGQRKQ